MPAPYPPPIYMGPAFSGLYRRPGNICRFAVHEAPLPERLDAVSSHGFGPGLTREPARAIDGGRFHAHEPASASVAQAAHQVAVRIRGEIEGSNHYFANLGGPMPEDASLDISVRATPRCSAL